jgi:hypothetical protein
MDRRCLMNYHLNMKTCSMGRLVLALGFVALSALVGVSRAPAQTAPISGSDGDTAPPWAQIRNDTYAQRAHFSEGVSRLSNRLDRQIGLLKAKRATMTTDTKDWDFAMKEVMEARSYLSSRMDELSKTTTEETWNAAKDHIGEAWKRSQLAVDKMNATITS